MGVVGMLIFIPIVSVVYALFREIVYLKLKKQQITPEEIEAEVKENREKSKEKTPVMRRRHRPPWSGPEGGYMSRGKRFDWQQPDHFRIVMLPEADVLTDAVKRMGAFLDGYRQS